MHLKDTIKTISCLIVFVLLESEADTLKRSKWTILFIILLLGSIIGIGAEKMGKRRNSVYFGIISDSHVVALGSEARIYRALMTFKNAVSKLDGVLMLGDIVYQYPGDAECSTSVSDEMYDYVLDAYRQTLGEEIPFVWAVGNHEYPQHTTEQPLSEQAMDYFVEKTGQQTHYATELCGIPIITAAAKDYYGELSVETELWLKEEIQSAIKKSKNTPILLMLHHPIQGTASKTTSVSCSESFKEFLMQCPQVINLTGHIHAPAQDPRTIWQGGFTAVQVPYLGENGYLSAEGTKQSQESYQGLLMGIDVQNVVKIYKIDMETGKKIGKPWEIDIPKLVKGEQTAYHYTDKRWDDSNIPYFADESEVSVVRAGGNSVNITFSQAKNEAQDAYVQDGFVLKYIVRIKDTYSKEVIEDCIVSSEFYKFTTSTSDMPSTISCTIDGLVSKKDYTIEIVPIAPFGKEGKVLVHFFDFD